MSPSDAWNLLGLGELPFISFFALKFHVNRKGQDHFSSGGGIAQGKKEWKTSFTVCKCSSSWVLNCRQAPTGIFLRSLKGTRDKRQENNQEADSQIQPDAYFTRQQRNKFFLSTLELGLSGTEGNATKLPVCSKLRGAGAVGKILQCL